MKKKKQKVFIYHDDKEIILKDIIFVNYGKEAQDRRQLLLDNHIELDFSSINKLKGNKKLLEDAFRHEKIETE